MQPTRLFIPNGSVSDVIRDVVTVRPVVACYPNFIKGLQLNNKYLENNSFSMWKGNRDKFSFFRYREILNLQDVNSSSFLTLPSLT